MKKQDLVKLIILLILVIIVYFPTFIWMIERWAAVETYYSHGFLVPLISLYIIWHRRMELNKLKIIPSNSGWLFFIFGILIHMLSALCEVYFTSGFSLILVLAGLVLLSLGKDFLRKLLFPILFLVFMIPLPMVAIANLSFRLKIFVSQIATIIVNKLGIYAVRDGSVIKTMHSYLAVEDPCSGIRSLIALIALGALMAYFSRISRIKKTILFISSIPISLVSNVIRIVALTLVSEIYGAKIATGIFHDIMGMVVFIFSFLGLSFVCKLLE